MKKHLLLIATLMLITTSSFAGVGWHITIYNNSNHDIIVTGKGGEGEHCWYSYDLDNDRSIPSGASETIYTEENNSGECHEVVKSMTKYQNFLVDGHYASVGSTYSPANEDGEFNAFRYFNYNPNQSILQFQTSTANPKQDSVRIGIIYTDAGTFTAAGTPSPEWI